MMTDDDKGIVLTEFSDREGYIIRVGIRKGIFSKTISSFKYVNKFITDKDIENIYIKTKDAFEKKIKCKSVTSRKFFGNFMEFEDFKKFMIYKYKLMGIEYKDYKDYKLLE